MVWFMELVLKTSDTERCRGFESLPLRQVNSINYNTEKYPSGRRGAPAKGVGRVTGARVQIPPSPPNQIPSIDKRNFVDRWFFVCPKVLD